MGRENVNAFQVRSWFVKANWKMKGGADLLQIPDHAAYDCLGRLVLGSSISPDDWQRFIDNSDVLRIPKGTKIIEAGELINQVYF